MANPKIVANSLTAQASYPSPTVCQPVLFPDYKPLWIDGLLFLKFEIEIKTEQIISIMLHIPELKVEVNIVE